MAAGTIANGTVADAYLAILKLEYNPFIQSRMV